MLVVYEGGGANVKRQIGRLSRFWQSGKLKSPLQSVQGQADLVLRIKLPMTIHALTTNQISIEDVKHNLLLYLQRVQAGEHFVIVVNNQPLAEIKPINILASSMRPMGLVAGEFELPSDFDDPLPNELLEAFEGV
jgi:antitoxin (DNA-binding transcriptional repressor) of toxin-antitoxin stability system